MQRERHRKLLFDILSVLLWCNLEVEVAATFSGWLRSRVGCGLMVWFPAGDVWTLGASETHHRSDSHCCTGQLSCLNASDWNWLFFSLSKKKIVRESLEHMALFLNGVMAECSLSWVNVRTERFRRSFISNTVRLFSAALKTSLHWCLQMLVFYFSHLILLWIHICWVFICTSAITPPRAHINVYTEMLFLSLALINTPPWHQ